MNEYQEQGEEEFILETLALNVYDVKIKIEARRRTPGFLDAARDRRYESHRPGFEKGFATGRKPTIDEGGRRRICFRKVFAFRSSVLEYGQELYLLRVFP